MADLFQLAAQISRHNRRGHDPQLVQEDQRKRQEGEGHQVAGGGGDGGNDDDGEVGVFADGTEGFDLHQADAGEDHDDHGQFESQAENEGGKGNKREVIIVTPSS